MIQIDEAAPNIERWEKDLNSIPIRKFPIADYQQHEPSRISSGSAEEIIVNFYLFLWHILLYFFF